MGSDNEARSASTVWQWVRRLPSSALALLLIWALAASVILTGRHARQLDAQREALLYARVLDEQTAQAVQRVDLSLQWALSRLEAAGGITGADNAATATQMADQLREAATANPLISGLLWAAPSGRVLAASGGTDTGSLWLQIPPWTDPAGTPGLHWLRADPAADGTASLRLLRTWPVDAQPAGPTRTSAAADHLPATRSGVLVAVLNTAELARPFDKTVADDRWRAVLAGRDGTVLAASRGAVLALGHNLVGQVLSDRFGWPQVTEPLEAAQQAAASASAPSPVAQGMLPASWSSLLGWTTDAATAGTEHALRAFRASGTQPWVVVTELSTDHVLAAAQPWEQATLAVAGGLSLVFVALGWLLRRQQREGLEALQLEHETRRQLREQFEQNEQLVDAMPVPVFLVDLAGTLLVVNRAWVQWMELDKPAATGLGQPDDETATEAARQKRLDNLVLLGMEQVQQGLTFQQTMEWPREHDMPREAVLTKVPLRDASGQVKGIIGTLIDITEYRQAERATERARRTAEELNQVRAEFVANVTHELRTPLQSIIGFAELGRSRSTEHARLNLMFDRIHQSGDRMLRLVEDLLDITRIGSHVGAIKRLPADPVATVLDVISELRHLAERKHQIELRLSISPLLRGCEAEIDNHRIAQVVRNVIANAMRFSPPQGVVLVGLHPEGPAAGPHRWVCTVRDQGPGIPEDELETIFQPFVQSTRTKDGSGGTGLGLTISRTIMQAHGGSIRASNHPKGGAEVRIELDLIACPAMAAAAEHAH